jgi:hypothetical protein
MTILFESPNVFYAVIDGVNIRIDNPEILIEYDGNIIDPCFEAKKCLHDTGIVCKISTVSSCPKVYRDVFAKFNGNRLNPGDIFQVEGFEYKVTRYFNAMCDDLCEHCKYHDLECSKITKVSCILKLAKEEEPKEKLYTIDEVIHKLRLGLSEYGKKNGIAGYWVLEDNVYYILNKLKK